MIVAYLIIFLALSDIGTSGSTGYPSDLDCCHLRPKCPLDFCWHLDWHKKSTRSKRYCTNDSHCNSNEFCDHNQDTGQTLVPLGVCMPKTQQSHCLPGKQCGQTCCKGDEVCTSIGRNRK